MHRVAGGHRRLVRLRLDAVRPAPRAVRERRALRASVPGRLHLRGARPDARLVLLAARDLDAAVRPRSLPQRRLPRPAGRRRGSEDVEVEGQRGRAVGGHRPLRRRRASAGTSSPPSSRGTATASRSTRSARRCASSCASCGTSTRFHVLYANAVGSGRRGGAATADDGARRGAATWTLGALAAGGDRRHRARAARRLRRDGARACDRRVRRGALELVRAPLAPALLGRRARRIRHAADALVTVAKLLAPFTRSSPTRSTTTSTVSWRACTCATSRSRGARPGARVRDGTARETVRLGLAARSQASVKVRQPLREAVVVADGRERAAIERLAEIVRDELNVTALRFVAAADELGSYDGQAELPHARAALRQADAPARRGGRGARPGERRGARCAPGEPSWSRSPATITSSRPRT